MDITPNDILTITTICVFGGLFLALWISVRNNKKIIIKRKQKQDMLEADADEFLNFWRLIEHEKTRHYSFSEVVEMYKLQQPLVYGSYDHSDSYYHAIFRQLVSMGAIEADMNCKDLTINYHLSKPRC